MQITQTHKGSEGLLLVSHISETYSNDHHVIQQDFDRKLKSTTTVSALHLCVSITHHLTQDTINMCN